MRPYPFLIASVLMFCAVLAKAADTPVSVTTRPLAELLVYPRHEAAASVISLNPSLLSAEVTARVETIAVEVGEVVEPSAELVVLDSRDHELALRQASAGLAAAEARAAQAAAQLKRAREVFAKGRYVSEDTLAEREMERQVAAAEVQQAQAALDVARRALDKCVLRAPFQAVVQQRRIHVGELAQPGTPLLEVIDLQRIQVAAALPLAVANSLGADTPVSLRTATHEYPLKLLRVSPAVQPAARSREARFAFTADAAPVGSEGRVVWQGTQAHLPPDYVARRDNKLGIFTVDDGKARFVELPQAEEGRPAPVDLPAASMIVDEGRFALQDGQAVTVR